MAVRWRSRKGSLAARCAAACSLAALVGAGCANGTELVPAPDSVPPYEAPLSEFPSFQNPAGAIRECSSAPEQVVSYSVKVVDRDTLLPPAQLEVQACAGADLGCLQPLARSEFDAPADQFEIELPTGFTGVLEFRTPGAEPTLLWLSHPLCQNERAQLPVWLLKPELATGSNRLLLQRVDCQGAIQPFPIGSTSAVIRVSPAHAPRGKRTFTNFSGLPLSGPGETDSSGTQPDLVAFSGLPTREDLAIEVFDYVERYEVVQLSLFASETAIASVFLVNCGDSKRGPH